MRSLAQADLEPVPHAINTMLAEGATDYPNERRHFARASALILRSPVALRAGDALHLAIAEDAGAVLVTFDRRVAEAGRALGLEARLLA